MDLLRLKFILPILLCFSIGLGCNVKLVSDYDRSTADELIRITKKVDMFYGNMSDLPDIEREYERFSKDYVDIESDIRSLVIRNRMRPLNDESIKISETILTEFVKYRKEHKEDKIYKNTLLLLHRNRLLRLFTAMSIAEQAKQINSEDKNGSSN